MNFKKLAVASAVAIAASSSYAAPDEVIFSANTGKTYSGMTSFTEMSTYTDIGAGIYEVIFNKTGALSITSVKFNGTLLDFSTPPPVWYKTGSFAGGDIMVEVKGTTTGKGSYSGVLSVTTVPEPETYALMLAGLGAVGFMARRRNKA